RGEDDQPDRLGSDDVPRVPGCPRAPPADGRVRHPMRLVPVLCDPEFREPAGTAVRVDALLPRSLEQREATGVRGLADRAEGPAGLDPRPDCPGERDPRAPCFRLTRRTSNDRFLPSALKWEDWAGRAHRSHGRAGIRRGASDKTEK